MSEQTGPSLKSLAWFDPPPTFASGDTVLGAIVKTAIGVAVGALFFALGARTMAVIVWIVAGVIGLISLSSQRGRSGIGRTFAAIGWLLGHGISLVILVPVYLIGFSTARLVSRLSGRDPLHLRDGARHTFWLECDRDQRKVRHIRSMFTTEAPQPGGRRLLPLAVGGLALIVAAEIVLRFMGFGDPVLYRPDAIAGYYPAPNQEVRRSGGRITINRYGMRAPEFSVEKPPGALRILMLGDSTLYGGSYIDQDDLYARRLERLLNERAGARRIEVLNMGANGWGPGNKLGYLEQFGSFGADIAIICLPYVDVFRGLGSLESKPFLPEHSPPRLALQEVAYHLMWRVQTRMIGPPTDAMQAVRAERGIAAYVELGRRLRGSGCEVHFAVLPSRTAGVGDGVPPDEEQQVAALRLACEAEGFPVDFPVALFHPAASDPLLYHDETHLHRRGHELYAVHLAEQIASTSARFSRWAGAAESLRRDPAAGGGT